MAETKLDILLRLQDQLSAQMKRSVQSVEDFTKSVERAGKEVSKIGNNMAFLGAGMTAPFVLALKTVEKFSFGVQTELAKTQNTWLQFNNTIAQAALPTLRQFNEVFAKLVNMFNSIDPVLREQIVHWTLISGAILVVGGAVLSVTGKFIQLAGAISNVIVKLLTFNPALTALIAIIGTLVFAFLKFHDQFMLVIDSLQYAWLQFISTLVSAWQKFISALSNVPGMQGLKKQVEELTALQQKLQTQMQAIANGGNGSWANGINNFSNQVQGVYNNLTTMFNSASGQISTLMIDAQTRAHDLAMTIADGIGDAFDRALFEGQNFAESMKSLFQQLSRDMLKDFLKTGTRNLINQLFFPGQQTQSGQGLGGMFAGMFGNLGGVQQQSQATATAMQSAATQTGNMAAAAQKGTGGLSSFFSSLSGTSSAMSVLGASMLSAAIGIGLGQAVGGENGLAGQGGRFGMIGALAGGLLGFAVGGPVGAFIGAGLGGFAGGMFHDGGLIAHNGLAPDEVPIIAQTGEGVLNRAAMNRIGNDNLRRLNRGQGMAGGGGGNVYLTQVIQAWDVQDVMRNKKLMSAGMIEELRTNGAFRRAMRES